MTHFEESALKLAIDRLRREHEKGGLEPHSRLIVYLIVSEHAPPNLTQVQRAQHRVREALQQLGLARPYQVKLVLSSSGDAALKRTITERAEQLRDAESAPILYPHMFIDDWAVISSGEVTGENEETWTVSQPFALSQVPVTQALYQGVMRVSPALNFGPLSPVVATSWFDAIHFCNQLSELLELEPYYQLHQRTSQVHVPDPDGLGIRLPTRAEWCYAACGGRAWPYAGSDLADEVAWSAHNSGSKIHPVARLKHNDFGLYDMSGNLWEWCHEGPQDSELGLLCAGDHHPKWLLGGSWANHPWVFPIGETLTELPSYRDEFMGFRIARNLSGRERAHIRGLGDLNATQHPSSSVHAWRAYDTSTPADSTSSSEDTSQGSSVQTAPPQPNSTQTPRED